MEYLNQFAFQVLNVATGVSLCVLTVEEVATLTGDDVIDVGAALEWYAEVGLPESYEPKFIVRRIPRTIAN